MDFVYTVCSRVLYFENIYNNLFILDVSPTKVQSVIESDQFQIDTHLHWIWDRYEILCLQALAKQISKDFNLTMNFKIKLFTCTTIYMIEYELTTYIWPTVKCSSAYLYIHFGQLYSSNLLNNVTLLAHLSSIKCVLLQTLPGHFSPLESISWPHFMLKDIKYTPSPYLKRVKHPKVSTPSTAILTSKW